MVFSNAGFEWICLARATGFPPDTAEWNYDSLIMAQKMKALTEEISGLFKPPLQTLILERDLLLQISR
jgi:hypothetical protein